MLIDVYVAHSNSTAHVPAHSSKEGTAPGDRVGLRTGKWPVVLVIVVTHLPCHLTCNERLIMCPCDQVFRARCCKG